MAGRLGEVLYWAFTALAAALAVLGGYMATLGDAGMMLAVFVGGAIVCWLIGLACRYVLAGT